MGQLECQIEYAPLRLTPQIMDVAFDEQFGGLPSMEFGFLDDNTLDIPEPLFFLAN